MTFIEIVTSVWVLAVVGIASLTAWVQASLTLGQEVRTRGLVDCAQNAAERSLTGTFLPQIQIVDGQSCDCEVLIEHVVGQQVVQKVVAKSQGEVFYLYLPDDPTSP